MRLVKTSPRTIVPAIAALVLILGCGAAEDATPTPAAPALSDEQLLRELVSAYDQAENAGDAAALANQNTADGVRYEPGLTPWVGRAAIEAGFRANHEALPVRNVTNRLDDFEIVGDTAYLRGSFTFAGALADGTDQEDRGKWITIAQRQADGTWLSVANLWNSDLPAPEGN